MPQWILNLTRIFYGFRWIKRKQTRAAFVAFYRLAVSVGCSNLITASMIFLVNTPGTVNPFATIEENFDYFTSMPYVLVSFEVMQLFFVVVYMRYLDHLHVARVNAER